MCWGLFLSLLAIGLGTKRVSGQEGLTNARQPVSLSKEQKERLQERNRLWTEVKKLRADGKLAEAVAAAEKVLAIEREVFGKVPADVAGSLEYLAGLHEALEEFEAARTARQEVLAIKTRLFGADHWHVVDARWMLADTERLATLNRVQRRRLTEAEQLNRKATGLDNQGKFAEALPLAQEATSIRKQVLGEQHPHYATSLNNLARLYESMGDFAKAEALYRQAVRIYKHALGDKHPAYASSVVNLANGPGHK
jgi:tetratricopeptide (TPR) repeat protein